MYMFKLVLPLYFYLLPYVLYSGVITKQTSFYDPSMWVAITQNTGVDAQLSGAYLGAKWVKSVIMWVTRNDLSGAQSR